MEVSVVAYEVSVEERKFSGLRFLPVRCVISHG